MMKQTPASATGREIPFAERLSSLPSDLVAKLATDPTILQDKLEAIQGEIEVIEECDGVNSRILYFVNTGNERLRVYFTQKPEQSLLSGAQVSFVGVRDANSVVADERSLVISASAPEAEVASNSLGEHKVLVILVNFQDKQTQPFTPDLVRDATFNQTSNYFREASYDQTWLTGDVYGWFTIPVSSTVCDTSALVTYSDQAAVNAGVNLANYQHLVYAFPQNACTFGGSSSVGGNPSRSLINGSYNVGLVGHELGHGFGLVHSHSMDCGTVAIGGTCTTSDYGDPFDVMAGGSVGHMNAFQKERLGWTTPQTITASGTYWIGAYEPMGNMYGLKILKSTDPVTGNRSWYYVEHRTVYGFDSFLANFPAQYANVINGVLIHTASDASPEDGYLLDMTPSTDAWYDSGLGAGLSFTDPAAGLTITTISADTTGSWVQVTLTPQSCVPANPTVTVSPGQTQWLRAGATFNYTVTVTNNPSSGCSATNFNLQSTVPAGWTAAYSAPVLNLGSGGSGTSILTVTSPVGTADGSYNVGATATNGSNQGSFGTASATHLIVSRLNATVSADAQSYTRSQRATMTANVTALGSAVSGAGVTFTLTKPNGTLAALTTTTGANGSAVFKYTFNKRTDPIGTYQVRVVTSSNGVAGQATTSFIVNR